MALPQTMTAAVFYGAGDLRIETVKTPAVGPTDVLIAVRSCGICGTDLNLFKGDFAVRWLPLIPGHELAGDVVAMGEAVTGFQLGDRVTADINMTCGTCYWCRHGENLLCPNLRQIGIDVPGAFAEYVRAPASQVYCLPDAVSYEQGASIEPIACAIHAQSRVDIPMGASVAVIGGGSMGITHAQLARLRGAYPVMLIGRTASKLERARRAGIGCLINASDCDPVAEVQRLTDGRGADVVIEAAGTIETYEQAFRMVRRGGTIVAYGIPRETDTLAIRPFDFFKQEWKVIGAFVSHPTAWAKAITLLESGGIRPEVQFSLRVPLEDLACAAADIARDKSLMKVFVVPGLQERQKIESI
jgi:L-iditol 2-dehydrogenase